MQAMSIRACSRLRCRTGQTGSENAPVTQQQGAVQQGWSGRLSGPLQHVSKQSRKLPFIMQARTASGRA